MRIIHGPNIDHKTTDELTTGTAIANLIISCVLVMMAVALIAVVSWTIYNCSF